MNKIKFANIFFVLLLVTNSVFAADSVEAGSESVTALDFTRPCSHGGVRKTTGSYDSATGELNLKLTITDCTDKDNSAHDGTVTTTGLVLPNNTAGMFAIDITKQYNTHDVNAIHDLQSVCTHHKVGTFDPATATFKGTIRMSDCVMTDEIEQKENALFLVLKKAHQIK